MPVFNNALAGAAGSGGADAGYKIERSLRFNDSDSAHLSRTFSAGNSQKWTWAAWVKRNKLGGYQTLFGHVSGTHGQHYIDFGGDRIRFTRYVSSNEAALETAAVYRDTAAWMHVCAIWDVGNSTANHRQRLFVNGVEVTEFSTRTNPSQNYSGGVISTAIEHHISKVLSQNYGAFQLADIHFLDGIVAGISTDDASGSVTGTPNAAYLTDFGEFDEDTGVWNPIKYDTTPTTYTTSAITNVGSSISTTVSASGSGVAQGSAANTIDGNLSTLVNATTTTISFNPAISGVIEFYGGMNTGLSGQWNISGGDFTNYSINNGTSSQWHTLQTATNVSSITIGANGYNSSQGSNIRAFKINGTLVTSSSFSTNNIALTTTNDTNLSNIPIGGNVGSGVSVVQSYPSNNALVVDGGTWTTGDSVSVSVDAYGTNGFHLDFSDNSSDAALGTDSSGNNNTWTVNNLIGSVPSKTLTRFRFKTDWNWLYVSGVKVNGSNATGTLDNSGSVWSNTNAWQNGSHGFGNETYSQSARGDWFDVTLTSGIANFEEFQVHLYLDSSAGSTTNVFEIELFFSDGTSLTKVYPTNADAPNQNAAAFNSRQWQNFGSVGLALQQDLDSLLDSPTNYEADSGNNGGNYATLNPLDFKGGTPTLANGNLDASIAAANAWGSVAATIGGLTSGKWYWEVKLGGGSGHRTGLSSVSRSNASDEQLLGSGDIAVNSSDGRVYVDGSTVGTGVGSLSGKTVGIALNLDANSVSFYQNNSLIHTVSSLSSTASWTPVHAFRYDPVDNLNFGQRPFAYTPPTGHVSLCTTNLPDPTIADGSTAFKAKTFSGTGTTQSITTGFSPDFVWLKCRNAAKTHRLYDAVRGATKVLQSDLTDAEGTDSAGLTSFNSDGFTLGGSGGHNGSSDTMVSWAWDGGDLATNSAYNQSDVWSSRCTGTIYNASLGYSNAFDGNTSTGSHSANGNTITFTPATAIPVSNSIKIYYEIGSITGTTGSADITINGTSYVATAHSNRSNGHFTVTSVSSITSMVWERAADNDLIAVKAIEVDGKILVDAGVIPAGSLNSSAYNQTDWTGSTTATGIATNVGNDLASVFDGNLANGTRAAVNGGTGTLQWTSGTIQGRVRIYTGIAGTQGFTYYNGSTSTTIASANNGWNDLGTIDLTRLDFVYSGGNITFVNAIELDGKLLVQTGVTLTNVPTIPSTVRANPTAGFSIVTWTGTANATVGHGLNAAPKLVITKSRTSAVAWRIWSKEFSNAASNYLGFDTGAVGNFGGTYWGSMTSTVIGLGAGTYDNNTGSMVAYCFAPVEGYSAFGSYIGNGSSDGPFVYTGFRPAFILYKESSASGEHWHIRDTTRDPINVTNKRLMPSATTAEGSGTAFQIDVLSNGFKLRSGNDTQNFSGSTYIYAAFAENPFKIARAR